MTLRGYHRFSSYFLQSPEHRDNAHAISKDALRSSGRLSLFAHRLRFFHVTGNGLAGVTLLRSTVDDQTPLVLPCFLGLDLFAREEPYLALSEDHRLRRPRPYVSARDIDW